MIRLRLATLAGLAAISAAAGAPLDAQSVVASRGIGLHVDAIDARAAGLGGVALGLRGPSLSLVNPAGIAGLVAPTVVSAFRFDSYQATLQGSASEGSTARFPLLHAAAPFGERWAVGLGYGALFDQSWAVESAETRTIAGQELTVTDRFTSVGGAGRFRLSGAYGVNERLAVGVGADLYTGLLRREASRSFGADAPFSPTSEVREWSYGGLGYAAGVRWSPSEALALAGAVGAGGRLSARLDTEAGDGATTDYSLPVTASVGGSARIAQDLSLAASGEWSGWSSLDDALGARDTFSAQGGLEWEGLSFRDRPLPVRLGARMRQLPFGWADGETLDERALTGGLGMRLAGGAANVDFSIERGWRGGGGVGIDEAYWRSMISVNLFGR